MKTEQIQWSQASGWQPAARPRLDADLVLVFGSRALLGDAERVSEVRDTYPDAHVMGCSTAGEICGVEVLDDCIVVTAIEFESTRVVGAEIRLADVGSSYEAGRRLAKSLPRHDLVHVFVLSDGITVNGSDLVRGMVSALPDVTITGGLSGDGSRFESTVVIAASGPVEGAVTALGLYGGGLRIGHASLGGWDPFGPERLITRSVDNVLHEVDGKSALELYKRYLGDHASGLPATGLLFPLAVRAPDREAALVRTILSVDEDEQSLTFAGNVPTGSLARLMRANFDRLVDGAYGAAQHCVDPVGGQPPDLAVLISCVGRRMVLKQRVEEEVEAVRGVLGESTTLTGFYSYGEISPLVPSNRCELHNQTMTITTLSER